MPPKGGHHHHHGGHGGGGRRPGPAFMPWGPAYGSAWDPTPNYHLVTVEEDPEQKQRSLAYVMSLPKNQRLAAYRRIFGKEPAHALGDFIDDGYYGQYVATGDLFDTLTNPKVLVIGGALVWWFWNDIKKLLGMRSGARSSHEHSHGKLVGLKRPKAKKQSALGGALARHRAARGNPSRRRRRRRR